MASYQYFDADGREIEYDDAVNADGSVRSGISVRVPLMLTDAAPKRFRTFKDALHDSYMRGYADGKKTVVRDPQGRVLETCEEEQRRDSAPVTVEDALSRIRAESEKRAELIADAAKLKDAARDEMIRELVDAWKDAPPGAPPGSYPYEAAKEDTACTINGAPGTLVKEGNFLVCRPIARQDSAAARDAVDEAWRRMVEDAANAWRMPE